MNFIKDYKFYKFILIPVKRESIKKALRGAMLRYSPEEYALFVYFSALIGVVAGFIVAKILNFPILITPIFFSLLFYAFSLSYPYILSRSRNTKIDLKLPHAIAYMRSLCNAMPLYSVFKQIFAEKDLYGEVSEEFGFIVRDVEFFGTSLSEAILNLASSTPSQNLREFLQGVHMVFESGGDIREYMSAKVENFRERARKQLEINMKTLEILAEVFSVLFVALPVFLVIVISTSHFLGKGVNAIFYEYLYVFLPAGGIMIIYVIDLINVKEDLSLTKIKKEGFNYPEDILEDPKSKSSIKIRTPTSFRNVLLKPFRASKENYYYSAVFIPVCVATWYLTISFIKLKFFESKIILLVIFCMIPLSIAFEYRARFVRKVEKEIPDLLRQILNLKDVGLTLYGVIRMLKESKIGVLNKEISLVESEVEWGVSVRDALVELVNRIGVSSIRMAITLILRANEVTDNIRDVLITAIEDFEYELKMKDSRFAMGFAYLIVIYLSFFVLLYVSYSMVNSFLSRLPNYTPSNTLISMMYQISIILAIFSGVIAGQMEKGHVLYGLKHIFVFLISSIIMFEVLIPGINLIKIIKI